jgi:hypothetical protein
VRLGQAVSLPVFPPPVPSTHEVNFVCPSVGWNFLPLAPQLVLWQQFVLRFLKVHVSFRSTICRCFSPGDTGKVRMKESSKRRFSVFSSSGIRERGSALLRVQDHLSNGIPVPYIPLIWHANFGSLSFSTLLNGVNHFPLIICSSRRWINITLLSCTFPFNFIRGPFERFVDSPYYSEICGGAEMVCFSKYLPWQAMHFLQRSTHLSKTCCRRFCRKLQEERSAHSFDLFITSKFLLKRFHHLKTAARLIASSP